MVPHYFPRMNWRLTEAENEVEIVLTEHDSLAIVLPCFAVNVFNCVHYFVGGKKANGVIAIIWALVRMVGIAHATGGTSKWTFTTCSPIYR